MKDLLPIVIGLVIAVLCALTMPIWLAALIGTAIGIATDIGMYSPEE